MQGNVYRLKVNNFRAGHWKLDVDISDIIAPSIPKEMVQEDKIQERWQELETFVSKHRARIFERLEKDYLRDKAIDYLVRQFYQEHKDMPLWVEAVPERPSKRTREAYPDEPVPKLLLSQVEGPALARLLENDTLELSFPYTRTFIIQVRGEHFSVLKSDKTSKAYITVTIPKESFTLTQKELTTRDIDILAEEGFW